MNLNHIYLLLIKSLHCIQVLTQVNAVVTEGINVGQTPPEIEAFEGDTINMQCSCEKGKIESIRVTWKKDSKEFLQATTMTPANVNRSSSSINETTARLTIENIIQHDSGMYVCQVTVEIPAPIRKGSGNGTKLTVQANVNYSPKFCAVLLLLILVPAIIYYKQRQKRKTNARASGRVVTEVINEENQENEGSEENTHSRGSSHWMASSLYESFDYFTIKQEEKEEACNISES
ncbi:uncharacterized protein LOC116971599 [Amblyraja radiata]|uniref:uncharacterized protein LOC116971599 n=1 Tax=Amblyraja radiata TaxID=386614 RepID=UPI0014039DAF|nr:uncharacterized protein LOC116971599 [Amblyraja radiata]